MFEFQERDAEQSTAFSNEGLNLLDLMEESAVSDETDETDASDEIDERPPANSLELIDYMITHGEMRDTSGNFTPAGMLAIINYIENGPWNWASAFPNFHTWSSGWINRKSYAENLLNERYGDLQPLHVVYYGGQLFITQNDRHLGVIRR